MFLGLDFKAWMGLTVFGAVISTIGGLVGVILKDYFFTRSERWKQRQTLEQVYQRFRDPLVLAARELASRTLEILNEFPPSYVRQAVLLSTPEKQVENSTDDPYFQKYKLISTAYRLSAFLAWIEFYRQEITFLRSRNSRHAKRLETAVNRIRSDLADGQLNVAADWHEWHDVLIFREELRAIGESLIETRGNARSVLGYGRYCEQLENPSPHIVQRWARVVLNFYLDLDANRRDFRQVRFQRLLVHIVDLIALLDRSSVDSRLWAAHGELQRSSGLQDAAGPRSS